MNMSYELMLLDDKYVNENMNNDIILEYYFKNY